MNVFKQRKINKLLKDKNYKKLTIILDKLNDKDLKEVLGEMDRVTTNLYLDYIIKMGNLRLLLLFSINSRYVKAVTVVSYIPFKSYVNEYYANLIDEFVSNKIDEFLDMIKKGYASKEVIGYIINFCASRGYQGKLEEIKKSLLSKALDKRLIHFWLMPIFDGKEFRTKLMASGTDLIKEYLYLKENPDDFIKEYVRSYPKIEDFKDIAMEFLNAKRIQKRNIYDLLLKEVRNLDDFNKELKSEYLYELLALYKNMIIKDDIIDEILLLKDIGVIKKLMKLVEEEQELITKKYSLNSDIETILILAITTDNKETSNLIEKVILSDRDDYIIFMIGNLEGKYLDIALNKVLEIKGDKYFTFLINHLYLEGYSNILMVINFVFKYKLEYLFDEIVINNFRGFRQKLVNNLTLIKK